jgi:hypothetical protein
MNEKQPFVYHGSDEVFDEAVPRRNIRTKSDKFGGEVVIFDEESFHATPYRWIALAYTDSKKTFEINGRTAVYGMGVSLYDNNKVVAIYGIESLEQSLKQLYGNGGYLYHFNKDKFLYKEGLGNNEVVTNESIKPLKVERIDDPVKEMQKEGVTFEFIDLSLPKNTNIVDYVS